MRVAIVGGGIAGLAAAYELARGPDRRSGEIHVTLLEADERLGGKIRGVEIAGTTVDAGPETILTSFPWAVDLCRELGLQEDLVSPKTSAPLVYSRGRLRPLPTEVVFGAPDIRKIVRSRLLSPAALARATLDLVLPRTLGAEDAPVGHVVRRRFGRQAAERLVDPLLGGIYAADCDRLSIDAAAPRLARAARSRRSMYLALRSSAAPGDGTPRRASPPPSSRGAPPPARAIGMATLRGGLVHLAERLAERLDAVEGVDLLTGAPAGGMERLPSGELRLTFGALARDLVVDGAVLATPAGATARLLESLAPGASARLDRVRYAPLAVAILAYPREALSGAPATSGFLVPRQEELTVTGCTWLTAKWPHVAAPGLELVRCSVGRAGAEGALRLSDDDLADAIHADLRLVLGVTGAPVEARVVRFPEALPQYAVGHLDAVRAIREELETVGGVDVAGAAYCGIGVPTCIREGREAARRLAASLGSPRAERAFL